MKRSGAAIVSGAEAADMFQTHGFPPELFETLAAERNLAFDWKGFREEMEQHGIESGGGQKIELFRHDPLGGARKRRSTAADSSATTRSKWPTPR